MAAKKKTVEPSEETEKSEPEKKPDRVQAAPVMEVDLSDADESDDDSDDEDEPVPKRTRREKKQERLSLRQQAAADRAARLEAEKREAYATGAAQAMALRMQQQGAPDKDPYDLEEEGLFREQRLLVQEYQARAKRGELSTEENADFEKRGNQLQSKLNRVAARREIRESQQRQPQGGQDIVAVLNSRWPQVTSNPTAFAHAVARYRTLITDPLEPAPDNWDTAERVMQETMERFGMVKKPNGSVRSEGNSRRYEGGGAGASGASGGDAPTKITLSKDDVAAADAAYPHLDPKDRYVRYAKIAQASRKTA